MTCRGRRRIGKFTLIEEFNRRTRDRLIHLEGIKPRAGSDNAHELTSSGEQLAVQTKRQVRTPANWLKALVRPDAAIADSRRTVVLLDEISWFGHYDDTFADMV